MQELGSKRRKGSAMGRKEDETAIIYATKHNTKSVCSASFRRPAFGRRGLFSLIALRHAGCDLPHEDKLLRRGYPGISDDRRLASGPIIQLKSLAGLASVGHVLHSMHNVPCTMAEGPGKLCGRQAEDSSCWSRFLQPDYITSSSVHRGLRRRAFGQGILFSSSCFCQL
jgi:hypothetical protein